MEKIELVAFEDLLDSFYGKVGTPERDEHERKVEEALHAYRIGETIKNTRLAQKLTQEQLGERIGVRRAQISQIERGNNMNLSVMSRIFKTLGISTATLDLGVAGKVALW